eukprot:4618148-Pyramimonas_sp.AAC.2
MPRQRLWGRSAIDLGDLDRDRWPIVDLEQLALRSLGVCTSLRHPRHILELLLISFETSLKYLCVR